ncbi:DUF2332 domain-containing protein [Streptomyces sp. NPDC005438]|uniref:DUF2332 domain-containing protein n=1 Tax=Streptomyces sp. NPDC005438 TaxID=3156880 RepID=UPI0033A33E97
MSETAGDRAARMVEHQAEACHTLGSPLYGTLLERVARDVRRGGPCARVLAGHEGAPGPDAIALRLLGGAHALALTGRAPELAAHYPSAGGHFDPARPDAAWPAFRAVAEEHPEWLRDWLRLPPQTNEVARATMLVTGLLWTLDQHPPPAQAPYRVRLFELGSSAGLNLRADHFRLLAGRDPADDGGFAHGPADSPVRLAPAWAEPPPRWLREAAELRWEVVERHGCDPAPLDPRTPEGALRLRSYLWPDQSERFARLEGALQLAGRVPARVDALGAADFLSGVELAPGTLTVVWHSVMRQYVPAAEWARVEGELTRLGRASGPDRGFVHLAFEPRRVGDAHRFQLAARWGTDEVRHLVEGSPHGLLARRPVLS